MFMACALSRCRRRPSSPPTPGCFRDFDSVAGAHGGNRAAGRPGHDASAEYVAARLREAGYTVELPPFTFAFFHEVGPAVSRGRVARHGWAGT
ncbi:hypothetical protein GCM10010176_094800 [Nonomuraea spiralis]|nr:hypothetical protein GCM10010176_094800 [Nonomuraea spiralis]